MKKLFIFITALLAVLALTACGSNKTQSAAPAAATTSAAQADASTNSAQRVRMVINGQDEVLVSIDPTPYGRDFLALLPLELTLKDYNGTEKISDLPRRLTTQSAPPGIEPAAGTFAYYAPWGNLAIFYRDYRYSNNLLRLGVIESGLEKVQSQSGDFHVRLERLNQ